MNMQKNRLYIILSLLSIVILAGGFKFYHYNYVANTKGQARALQLNGLRELVCRGAPYKQGGNDQCGRRGLYRDPDWGITAYFTVYGVETAEEAEAIAKFMVEARKQSKQENIPMNLKVYSVSRSAGGNGPVSKKYIIFSKNL